MISPWKLIGWVVVGLLLLAGMFAWNRHKDSQYATDLAVWKAKLAHADTVQKAAVDSAYFAGQANAQSIPIYLAGKTKIIHDVAGTSAEPAVKACFEAADARISACEKARKADSVVIAAQQSKIAVLESKPEPQEPRFQMYGAAGYSVTMAEKATHTAPAFRLGIDSKLLGPVRILTDAQLTMPGKSQSNPMVQANALLKITF